MKYRFLFVLAVFVFLCNLEPMAQDVIVKHDGTTILCKVKKVGTSEVEYIKWNNQKGPLYSIPISLIMAINYQNGTREDFSNIAKPLPETTPSAAQQTTKSNQQNVVAPNDDLSQGKNDAPIISEPTAINKPATVSEPVTTSVIQKPADETDLNTDSSKIIKERQNTAKKVWSKSKQENLNPQNYDYFGIHLIGSFETELMQGANYGLDWLVSMKNGFGLSFASDVHIGDEYSSLRFLLGPSYCYPLTESWFFFSPLYVTYASTSVRIYNSWLGTTETIDNDAWGVQLSPSMGFKLNHFTFYAGIPVMLSFEGGDPTFGIIIGIGTDLLNF